MPAQPLAVLLDVGGATTGRGALELLEPVRPRGLTTKRVQVKGGGAGARATVATAAYYLPNILNIEVVVVGIRIVVVVVGRSVGRSVGQVGRSVGR